MADGVHEVGLAEPNIRVQDEGIIEFAGPARDRVRGGVREFVGLSDYEPLEGVPSIEGGRPVSRRMNRCQGFIGFTMPVVH